MPMNPRLLRPLATALSPRQIAGLVLWLDAADSSLLYTTDAGPVEAVSSPLDISGCALWLDGADTSASSMTLNGSLVETWKDKSGGGRDFTATGSARPTLTAGAINSQSAVTFNGSSTTMAGNAAAQDVIRNLSGYTAIAVFRTSSVASGERLAFGVGTTVLFRMGQTDSRSFIGGRRVLADTLENVTEASGSLSVGAAFIQTAVVNHSSQSLSGLRNGAVYAEDTTYMASGASADVASSVSVGTQAGGTYGFWNGEIAEIIVYDTALTTSQRASVERYLAAKWGISEVHAAATSGAPVGYWRDKSGNGRHATQAKAANRPTVGSQNGRTALTFDGTSSWMRTERTQYAARSVFTVFRRTAFVSSSSYKAVFAKQQSVEATEYGGSAYNSAEPGGFSVASSATSNRFYWNNAALSAAYVQGASMPLADAANYQVGVPAALDTVTPAILYAEVAGEASGNQAWFVGTEPYGLARKYPADVLECLIYNRTLSAAERQKVEGYIAWKWGLQAQLPYDHPYAKSFAGYGSQDTPTDADALDYLSRMATADGAGVEVGVAVAVDRFIKACKADNIWDSIRASCILAGARTLAGALVPLKNEGPELWAEQTPVPNDANGSAAEWDAATLTMSNTSPTTSIIRPRFDFNVGFENGKQYRLSGRLSGDLASIRNSSFKMGNTGSNVVIDPSTGLFDSTGTASGAILPLLFTFDGSLGPFSVTIESMSIREVIDDPVNSPVGNGFTSGDYSRTAGLTGDGTSYLDSGRANDDDPQDSKHVAVYASAVASTSTAYAGSGPSADTAIYRSTSDVVGKVNRSTPVTTVTGAGGDAGLIAVNRPAFGTMQARVGGSTVTESLDANTYVSDNISIFGRLALGSVYDRSNGTLAFYSIGTSLSLEDLDTAVTNLITRLKFALLTGENPAPYDIDTLDYVVRGYENGGSLQ